MTNRDPRCPRCGLRSVRLKGDHAQCLACGKCWNWKQPVQVVKTGASRDSMGGWKLDEAWPRR